MGNLSLPSAIPAISRTNTVLRTARLVGLLTLTLALLRPTPAAAEPESTLARFAGSWRWVGGAGELRAK